jgi:predicted TIM-barrel fold metal-dependent hydrolase
VTDPLQRADELLAPYQRELDEGIPAGAEIFDAHVHCGTDIDGYLSPRDELLAFLRSSRASRAFCFCLDEPDRHPAFRAANDRTLEAAAQSDGMLIPFVRLDLTESPIPEAERCLDRGARGIKLHPRAQSFVLDDDRLEPVFAVAADRRVPILIHGGRGLPPIAADLLRLVDRHPESRLIIAHGGIADLAALAEAFGSHPGVFFDTSMWSAVDVLDIYSRVSPQQLLYASDYPYGQQPQSLLIDLRIARIAGFDEQELRGVLGANAAAIAAGELPELTPPRLGSRLLHQPIAMARIHTYLMMATPLLWTRQQDVIGALGLALNAADERDGYPDVRERISELIHCAQGIWRTLPEAETDAEQRHIVRRAQGLLHLADIEALTTPAE